MDSLDLAVDVYVKAGEDFLGLRGILSSPSRKTRLRTRSISVGADGGLGTVLSSATIERIGRAINLGKVLDGERKHARGDVQNARNRGVRWSIFSLDEIGLY